MTLPIIAKADHLPGLHALRLVAALAVFLVHIAYFTRLNPPVSKDLVSHFNLGVQLFYVLSAFALMHSTRPYERKPNWTLRFYVKRFFRIAPLFYVMIGVTLIYGASQKSPPPSPGEIAANVFFVFNLWPDFAPGIPFAGWSIGVEMLFYTIFPLAVVFIRSIRAGVALVVATTIVALLGHYYLRGIRSGVIGVFFEDLTLLTNLPCFAAGILAFLVYDRLRTTRWSSSPSRAAAAVQHLIFGTLAFGLATLIIIFDTPLRESMRLDLVLWAFVFAILTLWAALCPLPGLGWRPIQFLGERSYSLYLVHAIVILISAPAAEALSAALAPAARPLGTVAAVLAIWLVVVAIATLTYALIERPGMNIGKRLLRPAKLKTHKSPTAESPGLG